MPDSDNDIRPLDQLRKGEGGRICGIEAGDEDLDRLKMMGVCEGRCVDVVKAGEPMIIRVLGTQLGLAGRLGKVILVAKAERLAAPGGSVSAPSGTPPSSATPQAPAPGEGS